MIFDNVRDELIIYGTLLSLSNRIQTFGDEFLVDITTKQHIVLMVVNLFIDKSPSLKDVADVVGCSYQNVKKIALSLEKKGYLTIKRDENDKRKSNLVKTEKILEVSEHFNRSIEGFIKVLYHDLTKEQLSDVLSIISQMDKNLTEFSGEDWR